MRRVQIKEKRKKESTGTGRRYAKRTGIDDGNSSNTNDSENEGDADDKLHTGYGIVVGENDNGMDR